MYAHFIPTRSHAYLVTLERFESEMYLLMPSPFLVSPKRLVTGRVSTSHSLPSALMGHTVSNFVNNCQPDTFVNLTERKTYLKNHEEFRGLKKKTKFLPIFRCCD